MCSLISHFLWLFFKILWASIIRVCKLSVNFCFVYACSEFLYFVYYVMCTSFKEDFTFFVNHTKCLNRGLNELIFQWYNVIKYIPGAVKFVPMCHKRDIKLALLPRWYL